jgi:hypothetical protein
MQRPARSTGGDAALPLVGEASVGKGVRQKSEINDELLINVTRVPASVAYT